MSALISIIRLVPRPVIDMVEHLRGHHPWLDSRVRGFVQTVKNRDTVVQGGVGRGLKINVGDSAGAFVLGTHEPGTQDLLQHVLGTGMTFYDVGANIGFCSLIAARLVGPTGRVVSFEPLPRNGVRLRGNAALNGFAHMTVVPVALGGADGDATFTTSARPTWGKLESAGLRPDEFTGAITVPVRRLDSVVTNEDLQPPDMIKIDIEGAEIDFLAGAERTFHRGRPILVMELHGTNEGVLRTLANWGYLVTTMDPAFSNVATAHWNAVIVATPPEKLATLPESLRLRMRPAAAQLAEV